MALKEFDTVRTNLIALLEELDVRLASISSDIKRQKEPLSKDFEEQATETENDQVLDALGNAARTERLKVRQAIARIDRGEYGQCISCGEAIGKKRLQALPFAEKCMRCASQKQHPG